VKHENRRSLAKSLAADGHVIDFGGPTAMGSSRSSPPSVEGKPLLRSGVDDADLCCEFCADRNIAAQGACAAPDTKQSHCDQPVRSRPSKLLSFRTSPANSPLSRALTAGFASIRGPNRALRR